MSKTEISFSNHAVKQMFLRNISVEEIKYVLQNNHTIFYYPEDKPYPSKLIFASVNSRPLHVICCENFEDNIIIIITAYEPSQNLWENDFITRK